MKKLSEEERDKLIDRIMLDIESNIDCYENFVLDCVLDRVKNWEDDELRNWVLGYDDVNAENE